MRYFYTDPLAAAWMAKHFGMKLLVDKDDEGGLVDAGARFIDCDDTFRELWQHDFSYLGKLYVHPDSVGLLEPHVGDLCRMQWLDGSISVREWEASDDLTDAALERDVRVKPEIIQRNGKPFHWPEVEA
ncbi:hypothetical protein P12x_005328 [Tundrisphaera lichenicola]|uniref:hypothetical protein n=1 Tax=Tundrisphaera lichenicola TaxID=2029860 RepID=UPI003EBEA7E0